MKINDIQTKTAFDLCDIDVNDVLDYIGHKKSNYNLLYTSIHRNQADYNIVLGCTNNIPYLSEYLDILFINEPYLIISDKNEGFYNGSFNCLDYEFKYKSCSRLRILNKFRSYLKKNGINYHSINVIYKGKIKNIINRNFDKYV